MLLRRQLLAYLQTRLAFVRTNNLWKVLRRDKSSHVTLWFFWKYLTIRKKAKYKIPFVTSIWSKKFTFFFRKPLLRHCRSVSFENVTNIEQKVDKYNDVCEILIDWSVFETQDFESGFRFFCVGEHLILYSMLSIWIEKCSVTPLSNFASLLSVLKYHISEPRRDVAHLFFLHYTKKLLSFMPKKFCYVLAKNEFSTACWTNMGKMGLARSTFFNHMFLEHSIAEKLYVSTIQKAIDIE